MRGLLRHLPGGAPLRNGQTQSQDNQQDREAGAKDPQKGLAGRAGEPVAGSQRGVRQQAPGGSAGSGEGGPGDRALRRQRGQDGGGDRYGGEQGGETDRDRSHTAAGDQTPRPDQHGKARKRGGGAKTLQQEVGEDRSHRANEVVGFAGRGGVQRGIVRVVRAKRDQQRETGAGQDQADHLRHMVADPGSAGLGPAGLGAARSRGTAGGRPAGRGHLRCHLGLAGTGALWWGPL